MGSVSESAIIVEPAGDWGRRLGNPSPESRALTESFNAKDTELAEDAKLSFKEPCGLCFHCDLSVKGQANGCYDPVMEERDFFTERAETLPASYTCPRCKRRNDYQVRWVRRTKKDRLPGGASERDRTLFGKVRDHMVRLDDLLTCKTCGKRFEIPSHQSLVFTQRDQS